MYRAEQGDYSALDRKHLVWRPIADPAGRRMAFRDGLVFVHDFRFFFAIDASSGALRWAHAEKEADAVAAAHTGGALVFVTADGDVGALDPATGRAVYRAQIPDATMVRGATFDADGFAGAPGEGAAPDRRRRCRRSCGTAIAASPTSWPRTPSPSSASCRAARSPRIC